LRSLNCFNIVSVIVAMF